MYNVHSPWQGTLHIEDKILIAKIVTEVLNYGNITMTKIMMILTPIWPNLNYCTVGLGF